MIPIKGAVSEKTAYLIEDYPYGFTLRCQKKVWIETDPKHGQRIVEMTSNPKRSGLVWNKPKKSTYDALCGAFIVEVSDIGQPYGYQNKYAYTADDVGHVKFVRVGNGGDAAFLERYNALFGPFATEYERTTMINELAMARATVTLKQWKEEHPAPKWEIHMTPAEVQARRDWDRERAVFLKACFLDEVARIKANNEVPEPEPMPLPYDGETPLGIMLDGGAGDDL